jgi:hypothetical protein
MKTKNPKKKPASDTAPASNHNTITPEQITELFLKTIPKAKDGANNPQVNTFIFLASFVSANFRSFTFQDFVKASRCFEFDIEVLKDLFSRYVGILQAAGKVEVCDSVYDEKTYTFH